MDKELKIAILVLLLTLVVLIGGLLYPNENPCQEYEVRCFYGTRNTHTIDCNESAPSGYVIHTERSCIRR